MNFTVSYDPSLDGTIVTSPSMLMFNVSNLASTSIMTFNDPFFNFKTFAL